MNMKYYFKGLKNKQTKQTPTTPAARHHSPRLRWGCSVLPTRALRLLVLSLRAGALQMHDHYRPPLRIPAAIPSSKCSLPA